MLSKIDEYKTGLEVASCVNILIAIRGIAHRVRIKFKKRQFESVSKKGGITCDDGTVTSRFEDNDLFADLDEQGNEYEEVEALVNRLVMGENKRNVLLMNTLMVIMILTFVLM